MPRGFLDNGVYYQACEWNGECCHLFLQFTEFSLTKKEREDFCCQHTGLCKPARTQPCEVALHVSMKQISPNERKGYFLPHAPLTTTLLPDPVMCQRENSKQKAEQQRGRGRSHFSLSPASEPKCKTRVLSSVVIKTLTLLIIHEWS